MNTSGKDDIRARAISLFTFLREVVGTRTKITRSLDSCPTVVWLDEVPHEPECQCIAWGIPSDERSEEETRKPWLTVRRAKLPDLPPIPESVLPWVNYDEIWDSSLQAPALYSRILATDIESDPIGEQGTSEVTALSEEVTENAAIGTELSDPSVEFIELSDFPDVITAWSNYVDNEWQPWADLYRRKQRIQEIYTKLYSLYQQQKQLGETTELILGIGQLRWRVPSGQEVNRHLVCAQINLGFDAVRGVISIEAAVDGARPRLEQDMLEPEERVTNDLQIKLEEDIQAIGDDLWQSERLLACLQSYAHALGERGDGEFIDQLASANTTEVTPVICFAPALILRQRTDRGLLRLYEKILEDLRERTDIPPGLHSLVSLDGDNNRITPIEIEGVEKPREDQIAELYFPLPSNSEQQDIIRRLEVGQGVLVQGPPGTGKSHTIANLVCHFLATGQRVLVTSQTPRALRVLQNKLPKAIADLCVVLLGHDQASLDELEGSVKGITDRLNHYDSRRQHHKITELESQLDRYRRSAAETDVKLRSIRESDSHVHPVRVGGYGGTLQDIARQLREQESHFRWLAEIVAPSSADGSPRLTSGEGRELLGLLRAISPDVEAEVRQWIPSPTALMEPDEFERTIVDEAHIIHERTLLRNKSGILETPWSTISNEHLMQLRQMVDQVITLSSQLDQHTFEWAGKLSFDVRADQDRQWRMLLGETRKRIGEVESAPEHLREINVVGLGDIDAISARDDARRIRIQLQSGNKLTRWLRYVPLVRERRYIVERIRIGGKPCRTIETLRNFETWCDVQFQLHGLEMLWADVTTPPSGPVLKRLAAFHDYCEPLDTGVALHDTIQQARTILGDQAGLLEPKWQELEVVASFGDTLKAISIDRRHRIALDRLESLQVSIESALASDDIHPVVSAMKQAVVGRDSLAYREQLLRLHRIEDIRNQIERRNLLLRSLDGWIPPLAAILRTTAGDPGWDDRLARMDEAWYWLQTEAWLRRQVDPTYFQGLLAQRQRLQTDIAVTLEQLAAEWAWEHCLARMCRMPKLETYLKAWVQAVERIGAGTSKRATKYREVARSHIQECTGAIPAWIMPLYRVVETVEPGQELFDVVIVDEASQSGMEALFLNYLGKKIIVVGDDKQIAPDYVGVNKDAVELLRKKHIADLPFSAHFDLDNSLFDHGFLRYGSRLRLREHFRCMPEIIQFSNNLSYRNEPLIPLRQFGDNRLNPVVTTTYVQDGYVKGRGTKIVNPAEADAIVDQVAGCCRDPRYEGKTFGVISLQGEDQAIEIEKRLLQRIGPEEMERRNLVCGDAYAFQGDERNVMFLSLVRAPSDDHSFTSLSGLPAERRFNVAASRAQDQMWLFHSVTLNDLSPNDLRYRLLEYCLNPSIYQDTVADLQISDLENLARTADRGSVSAPSPFESWFEVDVFLQIQRRGYRVKSQFEIAGYRIDLVVAGMNGQLAVECDGEHWHGPDRYEEDMARQRQLERCGLRFWRIRGGEYDRDPEAAMRPLWATLDRLGIAPSSRPPVTREVSCDDVVAEHVDETPTDQNDAVRTDVDRGLFDNCRVSIPQLPDPRIAPQRQTRDALVEIIGEHGPMPCHYAYRIYGRMAGINLGKNVKKALARAIAGAVRSGKLKQANEYNVKDPASQIVRHAETPTVVMRPRGERELEEIPPSEIAAVMKEVSESTQSSGRMTKEDIFRAVLAYYELAKLTQRVQTVMDIAWRIFRGL